MLNRICNGICAGLVISAGGCVFLSCYADNKYVGAVFFCVALLCICMKGYSLYTGKICCIIGDTREKGAEAWSVMLLGLIGNTAATVLCGLAVRYAIPNIGTAAEALCQVKLASQTLPQTLIRSIFCGMMVYLSVDIYREKNSALGILFCIPTFILSGFEHSIADMFYFGASGIFSLDVFVFIMVVILGNSIGGLLLPLLRMTAGKKAATAEKAKADK